MKVAVHPLVVAVALGLVAPDALEAQASEAKSPRTVATSDPNVEDWSPTEAPTAEELHRVELEWLKTKA